MVDGERIVWEYSAGQSVNGPSLTTHFTLYVEEEEKLPISKPIFYRILRHGTSFPPNVGVNDLFCH